MYACECVCMRVCVCVCVSVYVCVCGVRCADACARLSTERPTSYTLTHCQHLIERCCTSN